MAAGSLLNGDTYVCAHCHRVRTRPGASESHQSNRHYISGPRLPNVAVWDGVCGSLTGVDEQQHRKRQIHPSNKAAVPLGIQLIAPPAASATRAR